MTLKDRRDHKHFAAIYDAHVRDVYRYVHRLSLDHGVAEDVTQDVFLSALRVLGESKSDVSISWLMRSARNRLIDLVRRETTYQRKLVEVEHGLHLVPNDEMGVLVESLRVRNALEALRPDHRVVLMLHYNEGVPVSELADLLGRSYKGAEGLLSRARSALRAELGAAR